MALDLDANNAEAYYNRALSKIAASDKDSACLDFKKAITLGFTPDENALAQSCK